MLLRGEGKRGGAQIAPSATGRRSPRREAGAVRTSTVSAPRSGADGRPRRCVRQADRGADGARRRPRRGSRSPTRADHRRPRHRCAPGHSAGRPREDAHHSAVDRSTKTSARSANSSAFCGLDSSGVSKRGSVVRSGRPMASKNRPVGSGDADDGDPAVGRRHDAVQPGDHRVAAVRLAGQFAGGQEVRVLARLGPDLATEQRHVDALPRPVRSRRAARRARRRRGSARRCGRRS